MDWASFLLIIFIIIIDDDNPERAQVYNLMRVYANSSTPAAWVWCKLYSSCTTFTSVLQVCTPTLVGHGTPGGTLGIKKVHFSSTPQPLGGVLLVYHALQYNKTLCWRKGDSKVTIFFSQNWLIRCGNEFHYDVGKVHSYPLSIP